MPFTKYKDPLFESPLEESFYNTIIPYLKSTIKIKPQFEVETICKKFRLDFLIQCAKHKIGIEIDAPSTHDQKAQIYDFWRDSIILYENHVDIIYRFNGINLGENLEKAILDFYNYIPKCFNSKKLANRTIFEKEEHTGFQINPQKKEDDGRQKIYNFLLRKNGGRLNPLIYKYKKQFGNFGMPS